MPLQVRLCKSWVIKHDLGDETIKEDTNNHPNVYKMFKRKSFGQPAKRMIKHFPNTPLLRNNEVRVAMQNRRQPVLGTAIQSSQ